MKYKLREICRGACGAMTIGKEYDIDPHGNFYDDRGDKCHKDYYGWSMPDSIKIAVSDGSDLAKDRDLCTLPKTAGCAFPQTPCGRCDLAVENQPLDNVVQERQASNAALNGGYPQEWEMPLVTGETFIREPENSGSVSGYYEVHLTEIGSFHCEDVIDVLQMTFNEGTAFKSLWRKAAARQGKLKANNTALRDAEKIHHSATRILAEEQV